MEGFHIPRKNKFASSPATAASSSTKNNDGGDVAGNATPSKPKSSEVIQSPDKSPGGRQILRRGDLVRLSNEQRSGRIQGGLARIARIRYVEDDADQETSEPIYDIEYILGGKVNNVTRDDLEYTTATAEGLVDTDDGNRGLRRQRAKRDLDSTEKQKEKTFKKHKEKYSMKQNHVASTKATTDDSPPKRKRGRPPKNPKKSSEAKFETAALHESPTKRPKNCKSEFERPPTSRQLANMEKEEATLHSPKPNKKTKIDLALLDRPPTSRQLANMEKDEIYDERVESSKPSKKSGKANTNATVKSVGKRKNTKISKEVIQKNAKRSSSRVTEASESGSGAETTSEADPAEARRLTNLYAKHRNEMEKSIQRLQKVDRYGFFIEDPPPDLDENYDDDNNTEESSDEESASDDVREERRGRKVVTFPDQPPCNFVVLKKRFAAGRYDLDMVALEQKRLANIKSILQASSPGAQNNSSNSNEDKRCDEADYKELAKSMLHPLGVDWETLKSDVSAMCDAAMIRDPDGASLGTGHLGFTAKKVKDLMEEMYNSYGLKRRIEMEQSEIRHKYLKLLMNCGNTEAAMQGKWRKTAFPERKYQRLETASVICDGLSKEDKSYAMYELETTLPDSFVGLAYMYDDAGQQSETWMKTVADETSKSKKSKKKKKGADDVDTSSADKEKDQAEEAAKALAKDDGVTRAQVETTMHTLKIQVQDRVMTDLGVMYQTEARSANWYDGDKDRNYDGGGAEVEQGTTINKDAESKWGESLAEVAEQEVWGIDCYTRKNVMVIIELEFTPEIATEFVEKWLPPAINACPVNLAHKMSMAARILEGLPLPDDVEQAGPSDNTETACDEGLDIIQSSELGDTSRFDPITPAEGVEKQSFDRMGVEPSYETDTLRLDATAYNSSPPENNCLPSKSQENSVFLRNALKEKIATFGPSWLKAAARLIRLSADSMDDDFFRIHPKGHGSVVIDERGLKANSLVTYYRGEVYPAWRWCEKLDAIDHVQKQLGLRPNLPDFYNMAMERPMKDPRGYSLLFVDASRKSGLGSSFSHSCSPTCEVRVVALKGKLSLAMTTLRDLEVGEELTFDYNAVTESLNEYRFAVCLCGHKNCRGSFLHFATADCYQQVLSRNSPIAARFANLVRGCMKQVMSKEDSELLVKHGFSTAAFGAVSFNHHNASACSGSTRDSIDNVPIWLRTFVADCLRYIEYERRALPVALLCNQMDRIEKVKTDEKAKKKQKLDLRKEKPDLSAEKSKSISGSRPKTSWMFYLDSKRDQFRSMVQKKHGSELKGLEFAQEVSRQASRAFKKLSDAKKEEWKQKAISDWKKNGGEDKAKLEDERQNAMGKKSPAETMDTDDSNNGESLSIEQDSNFEAKTISFADADAEGCSAMEQRIQQLAQSLSRVGRVLDRHRENIISQSMDSISDVNSEILRKFVPSPLNIMSDKDLVDWIWEDPKGIIKNLFSMVEKHFPKDSLLRNLLSATKVKHKLRLTNKNSSDAKKVTKEALLQFRKNILDFLSFADESMDQARKEKKRENDRLRREKAKKEISQVDDSTPPHPTLDDSLTDENPLMKKVQVETVTSDSQQIAPQQVGDSCVLEERLFRVESAAEKDKCEPIADGVTKSNLSSDEVMHIRGGGEYPTIEKQVENSNGVSVDTVPPMSPQISDIVSQTLQSSEQKPPGESSASKPGGLGLLAQALATVGSLKLPTNPSFNEGHTVPKPVNDDRQFHDDNAMDHIKMEKSVTTNGVAEAQILHPNLLSCSNINDAAIKNVECTDTSTEITNSPTSAEIHEPSNASINAFSFQEATNTVLGQYPNSPDSSPKKKSSPLNKNQVAYLKKWIVDHASNPYPTPEEKDEMIQHLGIDRKRLDSWLVRHRKVLLDQEIVMKWKDKDKEHWTGFRKKRYMLESTADLLLMYASTTTFFMLESFCRFDSTAIEVYARELGNYVPLRFALDSPRPDLSSNLTLSLKSEGAKDDDTPGTIKKEKEMQKNEPADASSSPEETFCSPDDVIDNVTVDYSGEYVLSQLLQWVNGGIGQAKGLPDFYGCIALPPISGCWEDLGCDEVKLPNYTRHNKAKATEYVVNIRPKLAEWFLNRHQRGSPWDKDLAKFFCSASTSVSDPTMPMGSPIIDFLITGMDENIKKISAALNGKDEESDDTKAKRSKLSTSDRLQHTVDEGMPAQAVANWVQCEDPNCLKWRKLPWHVDVDLLPEKFYCRDNVWNPNRQSCDATEDDWDMDDAPIKFDSNQNFEVGAWFDVQREGKIGYSEAQVVDLDFDSSVKRVKFTFYRLKNDRDEWVEVGSPRIAPHHSYTPRPFIGGANTKKVENSARVKRKIDDVESQDASDPKALVSFSKPVKEYLKTWMTLHAANPIPNTDEKTKIMSDTGLSERQLDEWLARTKGRKTAFFIMTDEQKQEKEQKKKANDNFNNFLNDWLLRPENMQSGPIAAATPTVDTKELLAKQLGVDRARIDSWFYRKRKKLKKEHIPDHSGPVSNPSAMTEAVNLTLTPTKPQPQTQASAVSGTDTAKPLSVPQTQVTTDPNLNHPSIHRNPQNLQDHVSSQPSTTGAPGPKQSSSTDSPSLKQIGLSDEAKQYLTQWLMKSSNPYPTKEMKDKIIAHFGIENMRALEGFLTRTRKKMNFQKTKSNEKVSTQTNQSLPTLVSTFKPTSAKLVQPRVAIDNDQINQSQTDTVSMVAQPPGLSSQMSSAQIATYDNFQSASNTTSMEQNVESRQSSNLTSLLTAVAIVNSQNQSTHSRGFHQYSPQPIEQQKNFAPPASAIADDAPFEYQHLHPSERQHYSGQQQHQQLQQSFAPSPLLETGGNASHYQFVQPSNGQTYNSEQPRHFSPPPYAPQHHPAQSREQSILTSYQNLHEMEIHNRLSRRSSPVMQIDRGIPASNFTAKTNGTKAIRETQQQNIHGQNPMK